jgi:CBS domain-containing protein
MAENKTIRELMTSNPRTVDPSTPVAEAARAMRDEDVGSIPIVDRDTLVGILTDRDIALRVVAEGRDPQGTSAGDVASRELVTVDPQQSLDEALRLMAKHQVRRLPVCEEDGRLVGIVAQADVALAVGDQKTGDVVEQISQP